MYFCGFEMLVDALVVHLAQYSFAGVAILSIDLDIHPELAGTDTLLGLLGHLSRTVCTPLDSLNHHLVDFNCNTNLQ